MGRWGLPPQQIFYYRITRHGEIVGVHGLLKLPKGELLCGEKYLPLRPGARNLVPMTLLIDCLIPVCFFCSLNKALWMRPYKNRAKVILKGQTG